MTSANINKIVRGNLALKPWLLSKNTNDLVTAYVQKMYKRAPQNFKDDLKNRTSTPRLENKGPLRSLQVDSPDFSFPSTALESISKGKMLSNVNGGQLLNAIIRANKRTNGDLTANNKIQKSPNYKIYSSRRFGSSASSSTASFMRVPDAGRRLHVPGLSYTATRAIGTHHAHGSSARRNQGTLSQVVTQYMEPHRNQTPVRRNGAELPATDSYANIPNDLMDINPKLKELISLGPQRLMKSTLENSTGDPMGGWNHPPQRQMLLTPTEQLGVADNDVQVEYHKLKTVARQRQFQHVRAIEHKSALTRGAGGKRTLRPQQAADSYTTTAKDHTPRVARHVNQRQMGAHLNPASQRFRLGGKKQPRSEAGGPVPKRILQKRTVAKSIKSLPKISPKKCVADAAAAVIAKPNEDHRNDGFRGIGATPTAMIAPQTTSAAVSRFSRTTYFNHVPKY